MKDKINSIKRVCVYGVGGVGGYVGSKIAKYFNDLNDEDYEIYFIARGEHLQKIKKDGLKLKAFGKEYMSRPKLAVEKFSDLPSVDLILLCVKGYDLIEALRQIQGNIKNGTIILPLLNGVDIYDKARSVLSSAIILPACIYTSAFVESPGVISLLSSNSKIVLGKDPEHTNIEVSGILDLFKNSGVTFMWEDDPRKEIWVKYLSIAPFSLITAAYNKSYGEVVDDEVLSEKVKCIMREIMNIAAKINIPLIDRYVLDIFSNIKYVDYNAKTSFQRDVENKGKRNEGDSYAGTILRLGKMYNVPTPVTEEMYKIIKNKTLK